MAELTNEKQFRFDPKIQEIVSLILPSMSPKDRELILREVEPLLVRRDWQIEDALSQALSCCGGTQPFNPGDILTSEDFGTGVYTGGSPDTNGHALDLYNGGTANTWVSSASGGNVIAAVAFGPGNTDPRYGMIANGSGGLQTGNAVLGTDLGVSDMQVTTLQNPWSGAAPTSTVYGVYARYADSSNYLWAQIYYDGTKRIFTFGKKVGGSVTTWGTVNSVSFGSNNTLQIITKGSLVAVTYGSTGITVFKNDVDIPDELTGQKAGFYLEFASSAGCDNFNVYAV